MALFEGEFVSLAPFVDIRGFSTIAQADAYATAKGYSLLIASTVSIAANTEITSPVVVVKGGLFSISVSCTLTLSGSFDAGLYQTFSGLGSVVFGDNVIKKAYPQWWGALANYGDGDHDDLLAIQAALDCRGTNGLEVEIPAGDYLVSGSLVLQKNTNINGVGTLYFNNTGDGLQSTWGINTVNEVNINIRNIGLNCTNAGNTGAGFADVGGRFVNLEGVKITNFKYGVIFDQTNSGKIADCVIKGQDTACIWLVNGSEHTAFANSGYTNNISIERNYLDPDGIGIGDDGGASHVFIGNVISSGSYPIKVTDCSNLTVLGGRLENSTSACITFASTKIGGGAGSLSDTALIDGVYLYPNAGQVAIAIGTTSLTNITVKNNIFYTSGAGYSGASNLTEATAIGNHQIGAGYVDSYLNNYVENQSYTPAWYASSDPPTIGNGTKIGAWSRKGREVTAHIKLTFGSTTDGGAGYWFFSAPFAPVTGSVSFVGAGNCIGSTTSRVAVARTGNSTTLHVYYDGDVITATAPITWSVGWILEFSITYLASDILY